MPEWVVKITDHSYWNDIRNWQALWDRGVRIVVLRLTVGASYTDPKFDQYYKAAKAIGFKVLAYHLMNPFYTALVNYANFKNAAAQYELDGPPMLDCEITGGQTWTTVAIRVKEACLLFEQFSGFLIIYTRKYWWEPIMGIATWAKKFFLFVASYWSSLSGDKWPSQQSYTTTIPNTWLGEEPFAWQFSAHGYFPEVSPGNMDKGVGYPRLMDVLRNYEHEDPPSDGTTALGVVTIQRLVEIKSGYGPSAAHLGTTVPPASYYYFDMKIKNDELWVRIGPEPWIRAKDSSGVVYGVLRSFA